MMSGILHPPPWLVTCSAMLVVPRQTACGWDRRSECHIPSVLDGCIKYSPWSWKGACPSPVLIAPCGGGYIRSILRSLPAAYTASMGVKGS